MRRGGGIEDRSSKLGLGRGAFADRKEEKGGKGGSKTISLEERIPTFLDTGEREHR